MNSLSGTAEEARAYFGGSLLAINYTSYCGVDRKTDEVGPIACDFESRFLYFTYFKGISEISNIVLHAISLSGIWTCDAEVMD